MFVSSERHNSCVIAELNHLIEHLETLFPAFLETKNQFFRQGWSSLKQSSLKSKIFNENGQLEGGGGMATTEFSLFCYPQVSKFIIKK